MRKFLFGLVLLAITCGLVPVIPVQAASGSLSFSPSTIKINIGQTATVTLFVSSTQVAMNSAGGTIVVPDNNVTLVSVSKTSSILTTWPEDPTISGPTIPFSGGLPTPGYTGSSGRLLSFVIRGKAEGTGLITLSGGKILANDGLGTNIIAGSPTATVTVSRAINGAAISSTTHPNQDRWYAVKDVALAWTKPSGATSFDYTFSRTGGGDPSSGKTTATSIFFPGKADGIWSFNLTANFDNGKTADSSFTVHIDTTPPNPFTVKVDKPNGETDVFPIFTMDATDTPSGIDHYEILIDENDALTTADNVYKLPRQIPGTHFFTVIAVDKAGNKTEVKGQFDIQGFPGPVITSYPKYVSVLQPINFKGRALYGTKVRLFIDGKFSVDFVVKDNLTESQRSIADTSKFTADQEAEWTYTFHGALLPGNHVFYATQVKADESESNRSNEVTVNVLASSLSLGGVIIPMTIIAIGLLLLIIVLCFIFFLLWRRTRKRVLTWLERFKLASGEVDREIERLEKDIDKDIDKVEPPRTILNKIEADIESSKTHIDETLEDVTDPDKKS